MLRRARITAVSLLALTSLSACAVGSNNPEEGQSKPAPANGTDPALSVNNPKNLKGITDACQLLTPEQRTQLGVSDDKDFESLINDVYQEPSCEIFSDAYNAMIDINANNGGMAKLHAGKDKWDNFTPTEVAGYPAAQLDAQSILCRVHVGVADDQSLEVYYSKNAGGTPEMDDPCGFAEKIAVEALKNVP
ncbi:DUF3558 domain-containing protein [Saccharopolyspora gregorii]|uniref:DUF3558 domain-containing protein n=1 Tax=Saccharopolyspora gregorii TaxID=33914 RepID=A0ABP6RYD2_9PSEU